MSQLPAPEPQVTVVIPCYNRADQALAAIRSVLDQDYPHFDVIAVDDGSTDGTWDVLQTIDAPNFRALRNTRTKGVSGARNTGAQASDAPWIAYQDSDDLWKPGKLRAQMHALSPSDVAVYCAMEIREGSTRIGRVPGEHDTHLSGDILPGLTRNSFISTQTVVIRHDVLRAVGGFDEQLQALVDWELMLRVAQKGTVAFVDQELVTQFMSGNSITRSTEKRLAAQDYVLTKHQPLFRHYSHALARFHHRLAGGHRQFGRQDKALHHALLAAGTAPLTPRYWAALGYAIWRRLRG